MKKTKVALLAFSACFLWSTAFVGIKLALVHTTPLFLAGARFVLAGLLLLPFCGGIRLYVKTVKENSGFILLVALVQTAVLYAFFNIGMNMVPGAIGAMIVGTSPVIASILSHFMMKNDPMTPGKFLKIAMGFGGIIFISFSRNPLTGEGAAQMLGILLLLCGSVASGLGSIIVAQKRKKIHPVILNSAQIGTGGLVLIIVSLLFEGSPRFPLIPELLLPLLYLAALSASAFSIWFYLLKQKNVLVSELNVWKFIIPLSGGIISWIILPGESPDVLSVAGMVLVALSVLAFYLPIKKKKSYNPGK